MEVKKEKNLIEYIPGERDYFSKWKSLYIWHIHPAVRELLDDLKQRQIEEWMPVQYAMEKLLEWNRDELAKEIISWHMGNVNKWLALKKKAEEEKARIEREKAKAMVKR